MIGRRAPQRSGKADALLQGVSLRLIAMARRPGGRLPWFGIVVKQDDRAHQLAHAILPHHGLVQHETYSNGWVARLSSRAPACRRSAARGPRRAGYPTGLWTLARVAKVIQRAVRDSVSPQPRLETADHSRLAVSAVRDVRGGEADANAHAGAGAAPGWRHPGSLDFRAAGRMVSERSSGLMTPAVSARR